MTDIATRERQQPGFSDLLTLMRFWSKVSIQAGKCWLWLDTPDADGYGHFCMRLSLGTPFRNMLAHRVMHLLVHGMLDDTLEIDHSCRNRRCVNPSHLEEVTTQINQLRGLGPAGINARKTHCLRGHVLAGSNVYVWAGQPRRRNCRLCLRLRSRRVVQ